MAANGKWQDRSTSDLIREILLICIVLSLLIPAYKHRSIVVLIIVLAIVLDHLSQLDLIPFIPYEIAISLFAFNYSVVLTGGLLLAWCGVYHGNRIFLFAGVYSLSSKIKYEKMIAFKQDYLLEIFKLGMAVVLTIPIVLVAMNANNRKWVRRFLRFGGDLDDEGMEKYTYSKVEDKVSSTKIQTSIP